MDLSSNKAKGGSLGRKKFTQGYVQCNELLDAAAERANSNALLPVTLPWMQGALGAEAKILLSLAQRYGAFGVSVKKRMASDKYKFYYSRASTGSWFTEVWPMWKVSAWFVFLAFFAFGFHSMKSGAGCLIVGLAMVAVFGPRSIAALRNSVVAGRLSGFSYARESFPMILAGAVAGIVMLEWAYVLPWNAGRLAEMTRGFGVVLMMEYGFTDFILRLVKAVFVTGVFAVGSTLVYQVTAGGMMRGWLETAFRDGFVRSQPEPGTWFNKLMTTGPNPYSGFFMFGFMVLAACGLALPLMS